MRFNRSIHHGNEDVELNLASIIDCFTVLITYLLVSASFIAMGAFDVSVLTPRPPGELSKEPSLNLSMRLLASHEMLIRLQSATRQDELEVKIPAISSGLDKDVMLNQLVEIKKKWPDLENAVLVSSGSIEYAEIVQVIEATKKLIPAVSLGERVD
jgi:biopolymer transport protein ExbD